MGLLARARSSLEKPAKGLLQRSLILLQTLRASPAEPTASSLPSVEELGYRIAALPAGFASPALLFALLREQLHLERAALLLYDARRHVYAPWASAGLDTTTRHRLRLPPGAGEAFNRAAAGEPTQVSGDELESFRDYFSSREFSTISDLLLVPFLHSQRLVALLLVANRGQPLGGEILGLLQAARPQAAPLLYDLEEAEARAPEADSRPLAQRVEEQLAACRSQGHPLVLVRLRLDALVRSVRARAPALEPFRLHEFLLFAFRRLLREIGWVEPLPGPGVLLVVHGMQEADPPLLLRQLEAALLALLRGLVEAPSPDLLPEFRVVTDDPSQALSLLSGQG